MQQESNYPASAQFSLKFSPYEDRLLLTADRGQFGRATILLTRRMVLLILKQILSKLPDLSGLNQTPRGYWQEVLQMAHQNALAEQPSGRSEETGSADSGDNVTADGSAQNSEQTTDAPALYLATELTTELRSGRLLMAFKGLPVPDAMLEACKHEAVVAFTFEPEKVHQLLEMLIEKTTKAQWGLPLDLPWLEPLDSAVSAKTTSH